MKTVRCKNDKYHIKGGGFAGYRIRKYTRINAIQLFAVQSGSSFEPACSSLQEPIESLNIGKKTATTRGNIISHCFQ